MQVIKSYIFFQIKRHLQKFSIFNVNAFAFVCKFGLIKQDPVFTGYTQVGRELERAGRAHGMVGYIAQLQVVDTCRHTSTATFSVETFNRVSDQELYWYVVTYHFICIFVQDRQKTVNSQHFSLQSLPIYQRRCLYWKPRKVMSFYIRWTCMTPACPLTPCAAPCWRTRDLKL